MLISLQFSGPRKLLRVIPVSSGLLSAIQLKSGATESLQNNGRNNSSHTFFRWKANIFPTIFFLTHYFAMPCRFSECLDDA